MINTQVIYRFALATSECTSKYLKQNITSLSLLVGTTVVLYHHINLVSFFCLQDQSKINLTGITKTGWGKNEPLVEEDEDPEPHPPTFKKKDLIPDLRVFKVFDQYAIQVG